MLADLGFYRQPGQHRPPLAEDQRLPQAPHAPVAVGERVDELELVVKHATGDQRMQVGAAKPSQQVADQLWHTTGWGSHVQQLLAAIDTHAATPELPRIVDQSLQQQAMRGQQIGTGCGTPARHRLIGGRMVRAMLYGMA
ncbi:hypothetical protein D3C78_1370150 [compost metagenome]